ncbi:MAG: AraC family transcriptional regulator [Clostridia bacterium]|nr:AraC family transcriptional regulator [Clostridia bacterium]
MEWIRQLQEALNYIESHLLEEISYESVASHIYMSPYAFHRAFSLMADMTAAEYIRRRRLSLAAHDLQTTDISVIDAALKYGYESPESFSKAFSRFHGVTPRQAKTPGTPLRMFNPLTIKVTLDGGTILEYRIVKKEAMKFIALIRSFPNEIVSDESDHSIPDFWDECLARGLIEPLLRLHPAGKRDLYGLCSPKVDDDGCFRYGIGIPADDSVHLPDAEALSAEGFAVWNTEPAEYAVFKCIGTDGDCITQAWNRFYREFLPQTGYRQTELTDFEVYPEPGEKGLFCELWIPIER